MIGAGLGDVSQHASSDIRIVGRMLQCNIRTRVVKKKKEQGREWSNTKKTCVNRDEQSQRMWFMLKRSSTPLSTLSPRPRARKPDISSDLVHFCHQDHEHVTNATVFCDNLEPTQVRWKSDQVHITTLWQGKHMCRSVTVSSLCAI